ncbi:MAG: TldD/PmbA family protein [Oscillospiraceae bacterium]|jgi:TldD protein|nr:TldD/PmbA family protein [Oscillospiraceae bacterium]
MLPETLSAYKPLLGAGTELRVQYNSASGVGIVAGNITSNSSGVSGGASARTTRGGYYGFASSAETDAAAIKAVLATAERNAGFLFGKLGTKKPQRKPLPQSRIDTKSVRNSPEQKRLLDFARDVDAYVAGKYKTLTSRYIGLGVNAMDKYLLTGDGAETKSYLPRAHMYVNLSTETPDGNAIDYTEVFGGAGSFEANFTTPEALYERIEKIYETLMAKRDGIYADAGVKDVILAKELGGMLAHEAVGHTTEADLVLGGSVAGPYLNKKVASELISMVDFANTYNGTELEQPIYVDDEGTIARDAHLITDGILTGYMYNRELAEHFNAEPTGNARAYTFADEPLVRMRNTAILPGTDKLADMIASIDDGYYLTQTGNGQADLTSEFMFSINMGYEIKNGKLGRAIRDTTISGVAFDLLKTVTMLGDEMYWTSSGMCGKKQPMPVSMGGPDLKCRVNIGGR